MPDTITPNYNLIKPEITGSVDTWGNKLNGDMDILDTQLKITDTSAKNSLQKSGVVADRTALDLLLYADTVADPSLTATPLALMTNNAVRALLNALMPVGTIMMWGGTVATIPAGWGLCDGTVRNGVQTPNMVNRFPLGAGTTPAPGVSGGTTVLSYSGTVGGHVLTVNEMPVHSHVVYDPAHGHTASDSGHVHGTSAAGSTSLPFGGGAGTIVAWGNANTATGYAAIGVSDSYTHISLYNAGSNWAHDHPVAFAIPAASFWPSYYTVCYIMRIAAF